MKRIGVIPNLFKDGDGTHTKRVVERLLSGGCTVYLPDDCAGISAALPSGAMTVEKDFLYSKSELLVTVGGDGTILTVSHEAAKARLPILGVNIGTVGFMTELETSELDLLDDVCAGRFSVEERMMLDVCLSRADSERISCCALNDVVLSKGSVSKLIEIALYANDVPVTLYRADGLIIATPTGSTAYSLSAGGPVIDTGLECICAAPVSPHSFLNSRPMIYSPRTELKMKVVRERDEEVFMTVDGAQNVKVVPSDVITVKRSQLTTKLVRVKKTEFYDAFYKKLAERR